ncbi:MAG: cyclic nucleotide-binding domain-containing protein [Gaiellaceae bacterium]
MAGKVDELKRVPLFSDLNQRQLRRLARSCKECDFRPGATVVRQGKMSGIGFFMIVDGEAAVSIDGTDVATLGPGDYFGELALISNEVRTATVTAVTALRCLVMMFWDFREFAKRNPDVSWKLLEHVVGLLADARSKQAKALLSAS